MRILSRKLVCQKWIAPNMEKATNKMRVAVCPIFSTEKSKKGWNSHKGEKCVTIGVKSS